MLQANIIEKNENLKIFFKTLFYKFKEDNLTASGAQVAYYLIMSIFPFLIFFINIVSLTPIADENLIMEIINSLPIDIQDIIITIVRETISRSNETLLSFSALTGLWAASKGTMAIIKSINRAYEIDETRPYIVIRLIAILFTLALLLLLALVLGALVFGQLIGNKIFDILGYGQKFMVFWHYSRIAISLTSMILILALLYRFSPSIRNYKSIKFIHTLPGGIFATLSWIGISSIFSYYVNNFGSFSKTYGSLGGIIALLLWLYISSIIIVSGGFINGTIHILKNKA